VGGASVRVGAALDRAASALEASGIQDARLEAGELLAGVLGCKRLDLLLRREEELTGEQLSALEAAVRRRAAGEPLQYIVGWTQFRELKLLVDRRVLIPRPETEVLVEAVLRWAWERVRSGRRDAGSLTALDVGTGSGAIALSLALEGPFGTVVATDVSADALEVAAENARRAGLEGRVDLRVGALWEPVRGERFDVVVSNPPYVAETERDTLPREVVDWEPAAALFGGPEGLDVLTAIIEGAPAHLKPGGLLALEVGYGQAGTVADLIRETGVFTPARIVRDLANRERVVLAEYGSLANGKEGREHAR